MVTPQVTQGIEETPFLEAVSNPAVERRDLENVVTLPVAQVVLAEELPLEPRERMFNPDDTLDKSALRNTYIYAKALLGRPIEASQAASFRVFVEEFAFPMFQASRTATGGKKDTVAQRMHEAQLYLAGLNNLAIAEVVDAPSQETVGVSRINAVKQVMHKYCPSEAFSRYFDDFVLGEPLPEVESIVPERTVEAKVRRLAEVAIEREPQPKDVLRRSLHHLLKGLPAEDVKIMTAHLLGDEVDTRSPQFVRSSMRLGQATSMATRRTRHAHNNGVTLRHRVELRDYLTLEKLLTDNLTFREPWTIEQLVEERHASSPVSKATTESMQWEIARIVERVSHNLHPELVPTEALASK